MKESYSEGPASHTGPELYAGDGNIAGVATTGVHAGQVLSSEMRELVCRPFPDCGKAILSTALMQAVDAQVDRRMLEAIEFAQSSPLPQPEDCLTDVYVSY